MVKLLLSSRAFSTVAVTDAFFTLVAPVAKNSARIVIIVNSVSTGKNHPPNGGTTTNGSAAWICARAAPRCIDG